MFNVFVRDEIQVSIVVGRFIYNGGREGWVLIVDFSRVTRAGLRDGEPEKSYTERFVKYDDNDEEGLSE